MMGDVVLRGKLPHLKLMKFSRLVELQRAWGVFIVTMRNSSSPPLFGFQIGSSLEQDRNVMTVQPWMSWWGNIEEESNSQIWRSYQKTATQVAGDWREWGLKGVLSGSDQSGKTWFWCHSGLTAPGTGRVLRQLLPGLLLWQPNQPSRKKL
jgi:hypothetical protein